MCALFSKFHMWFIVITAKTFDLAVFVLNFLQRWFFFPSAVCFGRKLIAGPPTRVLWISSYREHEFKYFSSSTGFYQINDYFQWPLCEFNHAFQLFGAIFPNILLFVFFLLCESRYSASQRSNKEMFSTATHIWFEVRTEIVLWRWRYLCENLSMAWNMNTLFYYKLGVQTSLRFIPTNLQPC